MLTEEELLSQVVRKLDQVVVLLKLANQQVIKETWDQVNKDDVSRTLLELSDGSLESGELQKRVAEATAKTTRTVQARMAELVRQGVLSPFRQGNKVFYSKSELFE